MQYHTITKFIKEQENLLPLGKGDSCMRCGVQVLYLVRHAVPLLYEQVATRIANILDNKCRILSNYIVII